ncbi:hypothetical protein L5515_017660 [Caenorhabditis briggsae]|uniref:Uncharacterized protein n=1 Tax=Caenorhabditis briggsae TaxID=6238 RepID=A0AAE9JR83_CAEBR|nr:hypothetical protein L5515_017660 [Caenorhabditis briggsae]
MKIFLNLLLLILILEVEGGIPHTSQRIQRKIYMNDESEFFAMADKLEEERFRKREKEEQERLLKTEAAEAAERKSWGPIKRCLFIIGCLVFVFVVIIFAYGNRLQIECKMLGYGHLWTVFRRFCSGTNGFTRELNNQIEDNQDGNRIELDEHPFLERY